MKSITFIIFIIVFVQLNICCPLCNAGISAPPEWAYTATIAGISPWDSSSAQALVSWALNSGVSALEIDLGINNTYQTFSNPSKPLALLKYTVSLAKKENMHTFTYLSGFEIITKNADKDHNGIPDTNTVFTDHPDWCQMSYNQADTAVFYGSVAFWLDPEDESAWVTPWNKQWLRKYMDILDHVALTGVDAIYVDVPYMMTHFEGWEDSWASFDPLMEQAFINWGGIIPPQNKLGNFDDSGFRRWIDFRYYTVDSFIEQVRSRIGNFPLVIESYPSMGPDAVTVACDPYRIREYCEITTHEYEPKIFAFNCGVYEWLMFHSGLLSLRIVDAGRPTWVLSYVSDQGGGSFTGNAKYDPSMENLANNLFINGCNYWETGGYEMCNSTAHLTKRTQIFQWMDSFKDYYYCDRKVNQAVGVYFSPLSRDYVDWAGWEIHLKGLTGLIMALSELHHEITLVTPEMLPMLTKAKYPVLIMANAACMSDDEAHSVESYVKAVGGKLVVTDKLNNSDKTGSRDQTGAVRQENALKSIMGHPNYFNMGSAPGWDYFNATCYNTNGDPVYRTYPNSTAETAKSTLSLYLSNQVKHTQWLTTTAPSTVVILPAVESGYLTFYLQNFTGLTFTGNQVPTTLNNLEITFKSDNPVKAQILDFLGSGFNTAETSFNNKNVTIKIPVLKVGAVITTDFKASRDTKVQSSLISS